MVPRGPYRQLLLGLGPNLSSLDLRVWSTDSETRLMSANLFWFDDEQWSKVMPHLPTNQQGPERMMIDVF